MIMIIVSYYFSSLNVSALLLCQKWSSPDGHWKLSPKASPAKLSMANFIDFSCLIYIRVKLKLKNVFLIPLGSHTVIVFLLTTESFY